jgi:hypothetical protein
MAKRTFKVWGYRSGAKFMTFDSMKERTEFFKKIAEWSGFTVRPPQYIEEAVDYHFAYLYGGIESVLLLEAELFRRDEAFKRVQEKIYDQRLADEKTMTEIMRRRSPFYQ